MRIGAPARAPTGVSAGPQFLPALCEAHPVHPGLWCYPAGTWPDLAQGRDKALCATGGTPGGGPPSVKLRRGFSTIQLGCWNIGGSTEALANDVATVAEFMADQTVTTLHDLAVSAQTDLLRRRGGLLGPPAHQATTTTAAAAPRRPQRRQRHPNPGGQMIAQTAPPRGSNEPFQR